MARKVEVLLTDDVDGSPADETVTFGLDGISYEIDLTEAHAVELRHVLSAFVAAGRRVSARRGRGGRSGTPRRSSDAGAIRAWARENGHDVSERGRISAEIREAYAAALADGSVEAPAESEADGVEVEEARIDLAPSEEAAEESADVEERPRGRGRRRGRTAEAEETDAIEA